MNMTEVFGEDGRVHPVTVISASPTVVTQVKTAEKDGYSAYQLGAGERNPKNLTKPVKGHLKSLGNFRYLKEFRVFAGDKAPTYAVGEAVRHVKRRLRDGVTAEQAEAAEPWQAR